MRDRVVSDVSALPPYGFGAKSPIWWGTLSFIALEGMGFVLAVGAYLYLVHINPKWPLNDTLPNYWPGTILLVVLVASLVPNYLAEKAGKAHDLKGARLWMAVVAAMGLIAIGLRFWEFSVLNVRWDQDAYGSITWFILALHFTHLATDVGDTLVLLALFFTKHARGKRFSDVSDNAFYWYFVVASWPPLYLLVYWVPRMP